MLDIQLSRRAFLQTGGALVVTFALAPRATAAAPAPWTEKSLAVDEVGSFLAIDGKRHGDALLRQGRARHRCYHRPHADRCGRAVGTVRPSDDRPGRYRPHAQSGADLRQPLGPGRRHGDPSSSGHRPRGIARTRREQAQCGEGSACRSRWRGCAQCRRLRVCRTRNWWAIGQFTIKVDPAAPLKDPKDYTIVGKSVPRLDIPAKIFGTFNFVQDVKLPGMLHARVVHPAAVGATLEAWSDAPCRKIPGYVRAVRKGNFLAVVATNEWAAIRASTTINVTWSPWAGLPGRVESVRVRAQLEGRPRRSVPEHGRHGSKRKRQVAGQLQATYDLAMNTHGSIGPSCAVAEFKNGYLTVWTPSQASHLLRQQLATMLQIAPEHVRCIYVEGAGCYGRNGSDDCSSEAALIAKEIGRPVRLQWMRADEHGWDPKGPSDCCSTIAPASMTKARSRRGNRTYIMPERPMRRSGVTLLGAALANLPKYGPAERQACQHWPRHPVCVDQQQADRALARRHTAAGGLDSRAGPHAEHVWQRELPGRDRCRNRRRSVRDPRAPSHRSARAGTARTPAAIREVGSRADRSARHRRHLRADAACPTRSTSWYGPTWGSSPT